MTKKKINNFVDAEYVTESKSRYNNNFDILDADYCPACGTRLSITGSCPYCNYHGGPRVYAGMGREYTSKNKKRYKPPGNAQIVKPMKGICSKCGSKNLRFFDDGTGRCPNCRHDFRWNGETSRLQDEKYYCNHCGELLEFIDEYESWYCHRCDKYI